jgi:putative tryptophan/tyrosine transport system substrate-binding protein
MSEYARDAEGKYNACTRAYKDNPSIELYLKLRRENPNNEIEISFLGGIDALFCLEPKLRKFGFDPQLVAKTMNADPDAISELSLQIMEKIVSARAVARRGKTHLIRRELAVPNSLIDWSAMPVIGFLHSVSPDPMVSHALAFRRGLAEICYIEGQNVAIEYRWAEGRYDRLPELAVDLVHRRVAVIAAGGTAAPALAAKAATSTIPIVFQTGSDPVKDGLVASLNRPGGNVTGVSRLSFALAPKRLELLHELVPKATAIAFLVNRANPVAPSQIQEIREPARLLGLQIHVLEASSERQIEIAFEILIQQRLGALLLANDTYLSGRRELFVALAARHAIPVMYAGRDAVAAGGLISYDASGVDQFRQVGTYAGRILKGEKPADLPVLQPTKFELAINLKTAKALGLEVPSMLIARADEAIE